MGHLGCEKWPKPVYCALQEGEIRAPIERKRRVEARLSRAARDLM